MDLNQFNAVLFDMDGVLYRGKQLLPGVNEMLHFLEERNIVYACVTNNSTMTPGQYETKLDEMGVRVPAARIITSSVATRRYLEDQAPRGTPIFPIGMNGLRQALFHDNYFVQDEHRPQYVVVGGDFEFTYAKARTACLAIRAGARFIGTNPDTTFPTEAGIIPGAGAILAMLQAASETEPFIIGKPAPTMFLAAIAVLGADSAHTLVVGDRLDTDIAGAQAAGLASALVLTGVTAADEVETTPYPPDAVYVDLPEILAAWRA